MSTTLTYTSNTTLAFTSSLTASVVCIGAGGHGSPTGNGGSGGAYAATTKILTGSFTIVVGLATATDGGKSTFTSASVIICSAPGGKQDGTITHQTALLTGSTALYYGGHGSPDFVGYGSYNGSGGGAAGSSVGNGNDGQSAYYSTAEAPALGGASTGAGAGGSGSFYYAGARFNFVADATVGTSPGGGGGGAYDYGIDRSASGADGVVIVTF